jgi:amino acid adenylation domain-containing protein
MALSDLPMLQSAERQQLLAWGGTAGEPSTETLHGRFEARAHQIPDAVAVVCEGDSLSYGELNRRANRLARRLRDLGVGPDQRVGLCTERSLDLLVGLLGILKAGGSYVPLDPRYPTGRLVSIMADADIRVLVGSQEVVSGLPTEAERVLLDAEADLLARLSTDDLPLLSTGESLAYVIHTSGSTGRPKGSLLTHGHVVRLFDATQALFGFGEHDIWTLFHSYAFDFSVWEIWGALLHGGRLVVVPYLVSRSPEDFHDLLVRERVTVLNQTPSAFAQLQHVDERPERAAALRDLRLVIFGGEALDPGSLASWFARHGDEKPQLVNMYGITETTVHVTHRPLRKEDAKGRRSVIGLPIPDLAVHVLDPWLRPAPIGVPGELVVAGAGLARGYLGRPDLTAERFTPDPVSGRPGARIYRSGDLARYLPDGDLEYLGRIDDQVKIRGFRIEPGEIEAALAGHPEVRECSVLVWRDLPGDVRLVAYVVPRGERSLRPEGLREHLRQLLPEHMVPSAFVVLDKMPLNPSGKIDRTALPSALAQSLPQASVASGRVLPRDPVELELSLIAAEVLGVPWVGIRDDFFALGGHSLLAVRFIARIRTRFGVDLPLSCLFASPTMEGLAALLRRRGPVQPAATLIKIQGQGSERPIFFVHPIGGQVLCYAELARRLGSDQPVYGLQAAETSSRTLVERAAAYLREIRAIQPTGPVRLAGWSLGGVIAFEMARQLCASGGQVETLLLLDTTAPGHATYSIEQDDHALLLSFARDVAALGGLNGQARPALVDVADTSFDEALGRLLQMARDHDLLPADLEEGDIRRWFEVFRSNHRAMMSYRPTTYPGSVILLRAAEGIRAGREGDLGWSLLAPRGVEVRTVPGHHYSLLREPHVGDLAHQVAEILSRRGASVHESTADFPTALVSP